MSIDARAFGEKLKEKGVTNVTCPMCGGQDWSFGDEAVAMPVFKDGATHIGKNVVVIPLFCATCGYGHFFNAQAYRDVI